MHVKTAAVNQLVLSAVLVERGTLRFTPAGVPVLDAVLRHESDTSEGGQARKVSVEIRAKAVGKPSEVLARQPLGSPGQYGGFIASARNGKGVVFHLIDLSLDDPIQPN